MCTIKEYGTNRTLATIYLCKFNAWINTTGRLPHHCVRTKQDVTWFVV